MLGGPLRARGRQFLAGFDYKPGALSANLENLRLLMITEDRADPFFTSRCKTHADGKRAYFAELEDRLESASPCWRSPRATKKEAFCRGRARLSVKLHAASGLYKARRWQRDSWREPSSRRFLTRAESGSVKGARSRAATSLLADQAPMQKLQASNLLQKLSRAGLQYCAPLSKRSLRLRATQIGIKLRQARSSASACIIKQANIHLKISRLRPRASELSPDERALRPASAGSMGLANESRMQQSWEDPRAPGCCCY